MRPKGFAAKLISQRRNNIFLVTGQVADGRDAFWYVMIDPSRLASFTRAAENSSVKLNDFGRVLASGWGKEPSEEVIAVVKRAYGLEEEPT